MAEEGIIKLVAVVVILILLVATGSQIESWFNNMSTSANLGLIGGLGLVGLLAYLAIRNKL